MPRRGLRPSRQQAGGKTVHCAAREHGVASGSNCMTRAGASLDMSDAVSAKLPDRERRDPADWHPGSELTPLEEEMVACAAAGELVDYGSGPFSLAAMHAWGPERTIRAAVLRHLLIGKVWPTDARGVRLCGIRVSGPLDLEAAVLHCPLYLDSCLLDAELVCLDQATATGLTITGCHLAGLTGELLTANSLDLSGSTLTGPLRLSGASMTGALSCRGAHMAGSDNDGNALVAEMSAVHALVIGAIRAEEANRWPRCPTKNAATPAPCCSRGWYKLRYSLD
jgi:hypothetical protein